MLNRLIRLSRIMFVGCIIMILISSCTKEMKADYQVEIVTFSTYPEEKRTGNIHKVVQYDSRTDSMRVMHLDIEKDVYAIFCDLEDHEYFLNEPINAQILNHPEVSKLIEIYLPDDGQLIDQVGPCYRGVTHRFISVTGFRNLPRTALRVDIELFFDLYLLFDEQANELIFVDSVLYPQSYTGSEHIGPGFFSSDGRYFFYGKRDVVMMFDTETLSMNVLSGGNIPIIPWNMEGIAIYNEREQLFKLLSEDGTIKSTIALKILPRRLESAFAIDSTTFVVTSSAPPKLFKRPSMEVYVLDFALGKSYKLVNRISALKILDAKRVK